MTDFDILQEQMITFGGVVVTTNDCSHDAVNQARDESRLYVDENGFGFVWFQSLEAAKEAKEQSLTGTLERLERLDGLNPAHSKSRLFYITEDGGVHWLHDLRGNSMPLTRDKMMDLTKLLLDVTVDVVMGYREYEEAERADVEELRTKWRNFETTGDPDVSPEELYKNERLW